MNTLLILILISVVVFIYVHNSNGKIMDMLYREPILDDRCPSMVNRIMNGKPNVWMYCNDRDYNFKMNWRYPQLKYNYNYPFEKLCIETFINNMDKHDVNVIILTHKNTVNYVPNFPLRLKNSGYEEKKVTDLLGAYILERYGGLWVSPYTITLNRNYSQLFEQMRHNDLITFGTSPNIDNSDPYNGTFKAVNNSIIGAKHGTPVIRKYKELMESYAFSKPFQYLYNHVNNDPEPLGEAIHSMKPTMIHYCCKYDGSYNVNDRKIHIDEFFGKMPIMFKEPTSLLFISIPYKEMEYNTKYSWIKSTPMNQLFNSGLSIVEVLKTQLKI